MAGRTDSSIGIPVPGTGGIDQHDDLLVNLVGDLIDIDLRPGGLTGATVDRGRERGRECRSRGCRDVARRRGGDKRELRDRDPVGRAAAIREDPASGRLEPCRDLDLASATATRWTSGPNKL